ncbi:serine protease, S1-C subfamily, contains C-terminal PDZ domain [Brevibacterium iodinum ATCC 49514]|uniref:Serine protease, S1-C subfamily, contains C-terminal PDZ domain n=1 Tax=Brevibacterium iodinum ATCC 49514 TaxID=1255616 RepID=A0A2H1IV79_9MICO|nr:trypsin-like peptidase domain-containing protein [Brevibacterium iodinum]SMX79001.1 serine protease, S1-C subfamily, contains C-terminal PDZ domain [Brevibacterium iodinum ATCC 49514]SUW14220.1 Periplasmic pH-dependent serine endoprotease DegQ precursor [Brevibacterium iodinum]
MSTNPRRRLAAAVTAAAAALALTVGTAAGLPAAAASHTATVAATQSAIPFTGQPANPGQATDPGQSGGQSSGLGQGDGGSTGITPGNGTSPGGNSQSPNTGQGSNGSSQQEASPASAEESTGVVLIDTELGYENAEAAGTGIVLSKDGLVLTNNHVIADSTKISVTVATTGKTYEASVVGSDSTDDVAVLQLKDASDLQPATIDDDSVTVGDDVTAVGNSEGQGQLQAADGTVTDLGASVTTTAQGSEDSETLNNMIQVQADIVSGDSGGALLDDEGEVVGMNTAASSGSATVTGFAIPIESALSTAESIIDGEQTSTNTLGYPAFLGIGVQQDSQSGQSSQGSQSGRPGDGSSNGQSGQASQSGQPSQSGSSSQTAGAVIAGVYEDTPAAEAGLTAGDTITAIGSTQITDGTALSEAIAEHKPGDTVSLSWTDTDGQTHSAKVTLTEGPAA